MSQQFTSDWYAQSYNAATAFSQAEANDNALKSQFSGASAPSNPVAGAPWYHTSKGLRIRNAANAAWLKVLQGDANSKTYFYRNDTCEGWIIDTALTDRVLAIKGGSMGATGGATAGSWDNAMGITNGLETATHTHAVAVHTHSVTTANVLPYLAGDGVPDPVVVATAVDGGGSANTGIGSASHHHWPGSATTWRPAAAVGTLQSPDLS